MGHREGLQRWHVASVHLNRLENVFRKTDGIQFEVSLEQQINDVVYTPFSGFFKRCSAQNKLAKKNLHQQESVLAYR